MADMNQDEGTEQTVKCPSCGADLVLESKSEDQSEDMGAPSMEEAQSMPLNKLKDKINKNASK